MGKTAWRCTFWGRWSLWRRCVGRCLLGLLTGCHGPAGLYQEGSGGLFRSRHAVIARQVVADSAVALATRPLHCGAELCREATDHVQALAVGAAAKRLLTPLHGTPPPLHPADATIDLAALDEELRRLTGRDLQPAEVCLYVDGGDALRALEEKIDRATGGIDVIMFYWDNDDIGRRLAAKLAARAGPDLPVRVLIDGGGNQFFGLPEAAGPSQVNAAVAELARHPYVQVIRIRNPFGRFDHRKVVLIDGCWAWTGGRNFARQAFRASHDLSFSVAGPLARDLQHSFEADWERQGGSSGRVSGGSQSRRPEGAFHENAQARLLHSEPGRRELAPAVYEAVDRARHHIYLENVYLSDSLLIHKLAEARRRGVDVRVCLTFTSGDETVNRSNRVVADRLLWAGVRVFVNPGMTHVKALCVDGAWAYVGTGNFDHLSFRHNTEVGLALSSCPLIAELEERLFLPDFCPLWELKEPVPLKPGDYLAELLAGWWL
jgi:cardiolipin synthase